MEGGWRGIIGPCPQPRNPVSLHSRVHAYVPWPRYMVMLAVDDNDYPGTDHLPQDQVCNDDIAISTNTFSVKCL